MKSDSKALKPHVVLLDGQVLTTSIVVAQHFGKQHKNVMQTIENALPQLSESFRGLNFQLTYRQVPGPNGAFRSEPMYRMTRDGFTMIAMGFTGKEAFAWKEAYIKTFNAMEQTLLRRASAAVIPSVDKPQLESSEFFLTLFYALNQERSAATLMWFLLKQGAHLKPFRATLREISKALDFTVSHSGLAKSTKHLNDLGLIEKQRGSLYSVLFDALVQHIESRRADSDTHPGLGDFVTPDSKRLLH